MKTQQPEALRLAEWLDSCKLPYDPNDVSNAAAELRRLHSVNAELLEALSNCLQWMEDLRSSGDSGNWKWDDDEYTKGMAAIAKAQE